MGEGGLETRLNVELIPNSLLQTLIANIGWRRIDQAYMHNIMETAISACTILVVSLTLNVKHCETLSQTW